jgi:SAM-dependent methyltransferase
MVTVSLVAKGAGPVSLGEIGTGSQAAMEALIEAKEGSTGPAQVRSPNHRLQPKRTLKKTMPIESGYRADLAYIHDVGHGAIARDAAARLVKELAGLGRLGTVVDVGCGTGILAEAMTEAGYQVIGVDVSEAMVAVARTRAPRAQFRIESFLGTSLPESVAIIAVGEVLCYGFDSANGDRERAGWFRRAHDALCPGGVLLFDIAGPDRVPLPGSHRTFATGPDWAVLAEASVEAASGMLVRRITSFRRTGALYRRDDEVHRLSLIDPAATLALLRAVGFEAEIIPAYDTVTLPHGVVAFLCRKPAINAARR